jgi:hypothetical protein
MFFDELVSPPGAAESHWSLTAQWTIIAGEDRTTCIAAESRVTGSKGRARPRLLETKFRRKLVVQLRRCAGPTVDRFTGN